MVTENPKLQDDPPRLVIEDSPAENKTEEQSTAVSRGHVSVLAILCVLCASLGFMFFPAVAAIPLGICALRRIEESQGKLFGRHLAIIGLGIGVTGVALWLGLMFLAWLGWSVLTELLALIAGVINGIASIF